MKEEAITQIDISQIQHYDSATLQMAISKANEVLKEREKARKEKLIQNVIDAINQLYKEFPTVDFIIPYEDIDTDEQYNINVMWEYPIERKHFRTYDDNFDPEDNK